VLKEKDRLATGAYKWKIRVVDNAGYTTDTPEKILRVNTHEAIFLENFSPSSVNIGGVNTNISSLNLSSVPSNLNLFPRPLLFLVLLRLAPILLWL